jgi:8-oxo-dGTP pyrophosphatase MutT (NUDIX family)
MEPITLDEIRKALESHKIQQSLRYAEIFASEEIKKLRPAAVLIPILFHEGQWQVLLTLRSSNLVEHSGQVSFPGGACERDDKDLLATAIREMWEEIGIHPSDVDFLGCLGDMPVVSGYFVRLFIGEIPWPYDLKINQEEVESTYIVPLAWLADPQHRRLEYRSYAGREFPVIFFQEYEGHILWGASAEMMLMFLEALKYGF